MSDSVVFLFDVDNTLLDNDRVTGDLKHYLNEKVGLHESAAILDGIRRAALSAGVRQTIWAPCSVTAASILMTRTS